jgi:hypothetical protein
MPAYASMQSSTVQKAATPQSDSGIQLASHSEVVPQTAPSPETRTAFPRGETVAARRSMVDLTASPCFSHAEDYSWLCGQVVSSRLCNGLRLRYASVDETDPYGGSVTLTGDSRLRDLKDGQYLRVQGSLCNANDKGISPHYHVDSFTEINPAN